MLVTRVQPTQFRHSPSLKLPMLDVRCQYQLSRIDPIDPTQPSEPYASLLHQTLRQGKSVRIAGDWGKHHGLELPRMQGQAVMILQWTAIQQHE